MEIKIRIAILSHLSDAQELINMGLEHQSYKHISKAYDQITFAKRLVVDYSDTDKCVSEKELNDLWIKLFEPKK